MRRRRWTRQRPREKAGARAEGCPAAKGKAAGPEEAPAPARKITSPPVTGKFRDVVISYAVQVQRAGRFATAKTLFDALAAGSGSPESPFLKGDGPNRGSLIVRGLYRPMKLKTLQNYWPEIQLAAFAS